MGKEVKNWWVERAREPSTYQGLSILAGVVSSMLVGDPHIGPDLLNAGLALAAVIQIRKREPVHGRDY